MHRVTMLVSNVLCVTGIVLYEQEKVDKKKAGDREHLYKLIAMKYKECMKDMDGRAPGKQCLQYYNIMLECYYINIRIICMQFSS